MQPTVFTEVEAKHTLWTEEVFGPVMGLSAFETEEQAVAMANDTNFGLAAAVISQDEEVKPCIVRDVTRSHQDLRCDSRQDWPQHPWG